MPARFVLRRERGELSERDEAVSPLAQLRDVPSQVLRADEQTVRISPHRNVADRVIGEGERREGAAGHGKIVRVALVSAVIITRNRKDALAVTLERLRDLPVDEILVVDNGSSDGTADFVRGLDGPIRLLEPGENLALGGRNLAAEQAEGELLLMLDDDAYPVPGAVETLVAAFRENPRLGVAGGFVRDIDAEGNVLRDTEPGTFDWWLRAGRTGDPPDGLPAFSFPEGACMIRRSAYLEVGGFFEPYFLASSEVDLDGEVARPGLGRPVLPERRRSST